MFLRVFQEFMAARERDPAFRPTRPVVAAYTRPPVGVENAALITDEYTSKVADLYNAGYGLAIQVLSRYYVHEDGEQAELQALADAAVGIMSRVIQPLGVTLTTLPIGPRFPGLTAGASFELQHREYLLPHRVQAFMVLQERAMELGVHAARLSKDSPSEQTGARLSMVAESFSDIAATLRVSSLDA